MSGPTDIEVSRALNALTVTLNDQKADTAEPGRWQDIVTGALGGEPLIIVRAEAAEDGAPAGRLDAPDGRRLAHFALRDGRWTARREGSPLSGGYVPR
jgi:hypothetical protein